MPKTFNLTTPPAAAFFTPQPAVQEAPAAAQSNIPAGFELKPMTKSKRLNLLIRPSTHDRLCEIAAGASALAGSKLSVNELINRILEESLDSLDPEQLARSLSEK